MFVCGNMKLHNYGNKVIKELIKHEKKGEMTVLIHVPLFHDHIKNLQS